MFYLSNLFHLFIPRFVFRNMHIDLTSFSAVFVSIVAFLETIQSCDLNCASGDRCEMRRSTCDYPPCPYFPTCVPDSSEHVSAEDVIHPGQCPEVTVTGPCLETCRSDRDCPSDRKCCYNGCGHTCRTVMEDIADKPGTCPRHIASMTTQCTENCDIDLDCPGVQKCCKSRCGAHCTDPCYYWLRPNQRSARKSVIWKLPFMCRY